MPPLAHQTPSRPYDEAAIWQVLESVADPEIPVLTVVDLGIVRAVKPTEGGVEVVITPTYSGCPAMTLIAWEIAQAMERAGFGATSVSTIFSPAWTTDWISAAGRDKLRDYGIAPPVGGRSKRALMDDALFSPGDSVACPQCGSADTERVSEFGSTACKALYRCRSCKEPFDYFKCI